MIYLEDNANDNPHLCFTNRVSDWNVKENNWIVRICYFFHGFTNVFPLWGTGTRWLYCKCFGIIFNILISILICCGVMYIVNRKLQNARACININKIDHVDVWVNQLIFAHAHSTFIFVDRSIEVGENFSNVSILVFC